MITRILWITLLSFQLSWSEGLAQTIQKPDEISTHQPLVLGKGKRLFKVGTLVAKDDFKDLSNWVVQLQPMKGSHTARIEARNGTLDCFVPNRGCTIWFKHKFQTRITISYDVTCPTPEPAFPGVVPTDINNFWMATDPLDPERGLFDNKRYTGAFRSYDKMRAYYASTGGGKNTTTRMRQYPREENGKPSKHLALTHRDGNADFLIIPDKMMRIQLVSYDDLIQYIVDGKLVYEVATGQKVTIESRKRDGHLQSTETNYDDRFPMYKDGFFGFRMVGTHHVYSNFRVHALNPS